MKSNLNRQTEASAKPRSAQRALWISVIGQALFDATRNLTASSGLQAKIDRADARLWLLQHNKDFSHVCALAGLDPDWVRSRARKVIEGTADKPKQIRAKRKSKAPGVVTDFQQTPKDRRGSGAQARFNLEFS